MWLKHRNYHIHSSGLWVRWNGTAYTVHYRADNVICAYRDVWGRHEFSAVEVDRVVRKAQRLQAAGILAA